ncbi:hypothetical protein C8Q74DRAFT_1220800 [Fomes fomentarius]|nr:hypothetical protein C8Q74DRAFT_1220800 [Fomes fomentarius]
MSKRPPRTHQVPKRYCVESSDEPSVHGSDSAEELSNVKGKEKAKQTKHKHPRKKKGQTEVVEVSSSNGDQMYQIADDEPQPLVEPKCVVQCVEQTWDLQLIFSPIMNVCFSGKKNGKTNMTQEKGRWCNICRKDKKIIVGEGDQAGWHAGANASCRRHIRSYHYAKYLRLCKEHGIDEVKGAWPKAKTCEREREKMAAAAVGKKGGQSMLDLVAVKALAHADNVTFHNCLVAMRPKTKWVDIQKGKWVFCDKVGVMHKILGRHSGDKLGKYLMLFLDCVGLGHVTNNNASSNDTTATEVKKCLRQHGFPGGNWKAQDRKFGCFTYIIQLTIEDFMSEITQKVALETKQAIWDYNPCESSSLLNGGLDVTATIRTLAVKVSTIHQFWITLLLALLASSPNVKEVWPMCPNPAHLDIEWHAQMLSGTFQLLPSLVTLFPLWNVSTSSSSLIAPSLLAYSRSTLIDSSLGASQEKYVYELHEVITAFIHIADGKFAPISKLCHVGEKTKNICWMAFNLSSAHWEQVRLGIKVLKTLASCWEAKVEDPDYSVFHDALQVMLSKLTKYYKKLDNSDIYILSLFVHPYYKLHYLESQWGGEAEYKADLANGVPTACNWVVYAREVVNKTMNPDIAAEAANAPDVTGPVGQQAPACLARGGGVDSGDEDSYDCTWAQSQADQPQDGWREELEPSSLLPQSDDLRAKTECLNYHWKGNILDYACINEQEVEELEINIKLFEWIDAKEHLFADADSGEDSNNGF